MASATKIAEEVQKAGETVRAVEEHGRRVRERVLPRVSDEARIIRAVDKAEDAVLVIERLSGRAKRIFIQSAEANIIKGDYYSAADTYFLILGDEKRTREIAKLAEEKGKLGVALAIYQRIMQDPVNVKRIEAMFSGQPEEQHEEPAKTKGLKREAEGYANAGKYYPAALIYSRDLKDDEGVKRIAKLAEERGKFETALNIYRDLFGEGEFAAEKRRIHARIERIKTEAEYQKAELGHERPAKILANVKEAKQHSMELMATCSAKLGNVATEKEGFFSKIGEWIYNNIIETIAAAMMVVIGVAVALSFANPLLLLVPPVIIAVTHLYKKYWPASYEKAGQNVAKLLTGEYLGETVRKRMDAVPPVVTAESESFFKATTSHRDAAGIYFPDTNHLVIHHTKLGGSDITELEHITAHEMLHYAAYLGGGFDIRFRDKDNRPVLLNYVSWLHEGLTELHAQQRIRSTSNAQPPVAYPIETTTGFHLQQLAGEETLRKAYLGGDFTQVRQAIDQKLGEGTFERIVKKERGADALVFLKDRLKQAGIGYSGWGADPIIKAAGVGA